MADVEITFTLPHHVIEHLKELAYLDGVAELERVLIPLIETRFHAREKVSAEECPWDISDEALREYLAMLGRPPTPDNLAEAKDVLEVAAIESVRAERVGQRTPVSILNGTHLRYRGPKPRRLTLHVRVQGTARPVLVSVRAGGR